MRLQECISDDDEICHKLDYNTINASAKGTDKLTWTRLFTELGDYFAKVMNKSILPACFVYVQLEDVGCFWLRGFTLVTQTYLGVFNFMRLLYLFIPLILFTGDREVINYAC